MHTVIYRSNNYTFLSILSLKLNYSVNYWFLLYVGYCKKQKMTAHKVFIQYYSKLCDTLTDIDEILSECVTERIISIVFMKEIINIPSKRRKVEKLLDHIAGPVKAGYTETLLVFLKIMKKQHCQSTVQLANELERALFIRSGDVADSNGIVRVYMHSYNYN